MDTPHELITNAFYDVDALCETLGLRPTAIDRARLAGELRSTIRGGRALFLGQWVFDWLLLDGPGKCRSRGATKRKAVTAEAGS